MSLLADASAANPTLSALWSRARADYISGCTATEACRRYGLSRSRFFERAREEGWRRKDDRAELDAFDAPDPEERATPRDARAMAEQAWSRADRALQSGDIRSAQGWTRLALQLRKTAAEDAGFATWRRLLNPPQTPRPPIPWDRLHTADDMVLWAAEVMKWPELAATVRPAPAPEPSAEVEPPASIEPPAEIEAPAEPSIENTPHLGDGPFAPNAPAPDSADYFDEPDSRPSAFEPEPEPDEEPPPMPPEQQAQWLAWAAVSEQMRAEHPGEAWWGEEVAVDPALDGPVQPASSAMGAREPDEGFG